MPVAVLGLTVLALVLVPGVSIQRNAATHDLSRDETARDFLAAAFREAAPDAVILTSGDERTFALWYGRYGLRSRLDIAVLNVNLFGFDWYRRTLAETHDDLLPSAPGAEPADDSSSPSLEELLALIATRRPLYAADDLALALPGLTREPVGVLTRLRTP
jgi:hypothetical protein